MLKKKFIFLVTIFALLLSLPSSVHAKDEIEIINNVGMGNVSISLINQQLNDKKEAVDWVQNQIVVPGETISHITKIKNEGEPAWIRARVLFDTASKVNITEEDTHFVDGWVKKPDGYYYWTKEVKTDEIVSFIDEITIPEAWASVEVKQTDFHISIQADAVQTKNFKPDFDANQPWFGTIIETSLYNYTRTSKTSDAKFLVSYVGGAEGLFAKGSDFFSNWTTIMPGDKLTDSSSVSNSYSQGIKLYFRSENAMSSELATKLIIKITRGDDVVYNGPLSGTVKEINIANMKSGAQFDLKYELTVPSELDNKYSLSEAQTRWIFRAELIPNNPTNTGDIGSPITFMAVAMVSLVAIAYLFTKKKGIGYASKNIK